MDTDFQRNHFGKSRLKFYLSKSVFICVNLCKSVVTFSYETKHRAHRFSRGGLQRSHKIYTEKLDFVLLEDTPQSETKRWVKVAPRGASECSLLLAKAVGDEQTSRVGNQTGGRFFLFLETDDFWRDYENYKAKGVNFAREPKTEDYGTVAVFEDLYGNLLDLVEFKNK